VPGHFGIEIQIGTPFRFSASQNLFKTNFGFGISQRGPSAVKKKDNNPIPNQWSAKPSLP
jgi:hypothetical protein